MKSELIIVDDCNDCGCHFLVKLTVTEQMMNQDSKTLETFKDVSARFMNKHAVNDRVYLFIDY